MTDQPEITQKTNNKSKSQKRDYIAAVGRRKSAVARIRLFKSVKDGLAWGETPVKKGEILVNGKSIEQYFGGEVAKKLYLEPLRITNALQQGFAFTVKVAGGGPAGQLEAVIAGFANALNKLDTEKYRPALKKKGFLTHDARVRQRRKVGMGGKSRRKRQSPKR